MKMKKWQKENAFSQVHHEMLSVKKKSKINTAENIDEQGLKLGLELFSRTRITNVTSVTVSGAPGNRGSEY